MDILGKGTGQSEFSTSVGPFEHYGMRDTPAVGHAPQSALHILMSRYVSESHFCGIPWLAT